MHISGTCCLHCILSRDSEAPTIFINLGVLLTSWLKSLVSEKPGFKSQLCCCLAV